MTDSAQQQHTFAALNPLLSCELCHGYLRDASTLLECFHSFCRPCLQRYLQRHTIIKPSRHWLCPARKQRCPVKLHSSDPWKHEVRRDRQLQSLVDKLLPDYAAEQAAVETQVRKQWKAAQKRRRQDGGEQHQLHRKIIIEVAPHSSSSSAVIAHRYIQCSQLATVWHLQRVLTSLLPASASSSSSAALADELQLYVREREVTKHMTLKQIRDELWSNLEQVILLHYKLPARAQEQSQQQPPSHTVISCNQT